MKISITKTSSCNEHPLTPHFYIVKLRITGVYIFFLFLLQNMDCGYSLEPPQAVLMCTYNQSFEQKEEKHIKKNHLKMNIFTAVKYYCIFHGRVFVMSE